MKRLQATILRAYFSITIKSAKQNKNNCYSKNENFRANSKHSHTFFSPNIALIIKMVLLKGTASALNVSYMWKISAQFSSQNPRTYRVKSSES